MDKRDEEQLEMNLTPLDQAQDYALEIVDLRHEVKALEEALALSDAKFNLLEALYNKQVRVKPNKITGENRGDDNSRYNWVAGGGGSEREFKGRTGDRLIYLWNNVTGEHAHFNITKDTFLTNEQLDEVGFV
jgi:hypothetical protein